MQKELVSVVLAGLLMLGVSVNAIAGAAASDVVCTGCVGTTDIANAAVTETKLGTNAVTNTKIANGAVTDAKISGQISASKIQKPSNLIVVATSGGDFTSIGAALASLPIPNPDTNPVVIKVMPGTYTENITMKSNVNLQGAGRDVTVIDGAITISADPVAISGFTIDGSYGCLQVNSSAPTISGNLFLMNSPACSGVIQNNSASPIIEGNVFKNINGRAILSQNGSSALIKNNNIFNTGNWVISDLSSSSTITGNVIEGAGDGMEISNSSTKIIGNVMKNGYRGMRIFGASYDGGQVIVKDNVITGNSQEDINCLGAIPLINSNVYSTFVGSGAVGNYNLKPDGTPAPLQ